MGVELSVGALVRDAQVRERVVVNLLGTAATASKLLAVMAPMAASCWSSESY